MHIQYKCCKEDFKETLGSLICHISFLPSITQHNPLSLWKATTLLQFTLMSVYNLHLYAFITSVFPSKPIKSEKTLCTIQLLLQIVLKIGLRLDPSFRGHWQTAPHRPYVMWLDPHHMKAYRHTGGLRNQWQALLRAHSPYQLCNNTNR